MSCPVSRLFRSLSARLGVVSPSISTFQYLSIRICVLGWFVRCLCEFGLQVAFGFGLGVLALSLSVYTLSTFP